VGWGLTILGTTLIECSTTKRAMTAAGQATDFDERSSQQVELDERLGDKHEALTVWWLASPT